MNDSSPPTYLLQLTTYLVPPTFSWMISPVTGELKLLQFPAMLGCGLQSTGCISALSRDRAQGRPALHPM